MESYIILIYRGDKKHPRGLVGIVEEVGKKEKRAFTNLDELWDILNASRDRSKKRSHKKSFVLAHDKIKDIKRRQAIH